MNRSMKHRGFSLVELMIGMTLALLGLVVILQVLVVSQSHKKAAVSSGDAQQNGAMALYDVQNAIENAGYGIGAALYDTSNSCTDATGAYLPVAGYRNGVPAGLDFSFWLAPVVITDGGGGKPDTITVMQGNTSGTVSTTDVAASTSSTITVTAGSTFNFNLGDVFLLYQSGYGCMVGQLTAKDAVSSLSFTAGGVYQSPYTGNNENSIYNKAGGITSAADAGLYKFVDGAKLLDLGPSPSLITYSVNNGALNAAAAGVFAGANEVVADGIVNLQAQYGVDTDGDGAVDQYVDAPNTNPPLLDFNADGKIDQADWLRVRAIRVAVLARGVAREATCDSKQPSWSGGNFDMSTLPDWQCYRYRVYETTIPLRNVAWDPT